MKDVIYKKSGLRTAGKVFSIIDIVLDVLFILGAIAMFVVNSIIIKKVGDQGGTEEGKKWLDIAALLKTWGIVAIVIGCVALAVSIFSLHLLKKSVSFPMMLGFGIGNFVTGVGVIVGIFMIIIACVECRGAKPNKNTTK